MAQYEFLRKKNKFIIIQANLTDGLINQFDAKKSSMIYLNANYLCGSCRAMMTKGMVFRYTWVYSKEDTMAYTCRPVVTS